MQTSAGHTPVLHPSPPEYTKKIEKDNIAVFFHRIRPVFENKSVVV